MSPPDNLPPARKRVRPSPSPPSIEQTQPRHIEAEAESTPKAEYEVGFGKPPKATQFKPGQSGNPRGRPKGAKSLNAMILEIMDESVTLTTASGRKRMRRSEVLLRKMIEKALKGDQRAMDQALRYYQAAKVAEVEQELAAGEADAAEPITEADEASLALLKDMLLAGREGEGHHGTA